MDYSYQSTLLPYISPGWCLSAILHPTQYIPSVHALSLSLSFGRACPYLKGLNTICSPEIFTLLYFFWITYKKFKSDKSWHGLLGPPAFLISLHLETWPAPSIYLYPPVYFLPSIFLLFLFFYCFLSLSEFSGLGLKKKITLNFTMTPFSISNISSKTSCKIIISTASLNDLHTIILSLNPSGSRDWNLIELLLLFSQHITLLSPCSIF